MDVLCVGDCGVDHYLPSNERFFGGITANVARHARRLFPADDVIRIVSCIGDDDGATIVNAGLAKSGIDCHMSRLPGRTPVQYIEVQSDGEKKFVRYDEGVLRDFRFDPSQILLIADSDLMVAPVYLQIVGLFDTLMSIETRGLVAIDFADFLQHPDFSLLERYIERIDIGFFGLTPDDSDAIERIAALAAQHDKLFVVTLGAHGSRAFAGSQQFGCAAMSVSQVVDTTGAGDAFAAAFLACYCHGGGVSAALQAGAKAAATVIGVRGSV